MTAVSPHHSRRSLSHPPRNGLAVNRVWFNRAYQIRFITRLFLIIFTITITGSLLAILTLWSLLYRAGAENQHLLIAALVGVGVAVLIELLVAVPLVYYLGARQSHQVVGPLRRITRALGAIGTGDFAQRVVVRQDDVLETIAESINRMAERLHKRHNNHGR